MIYTDTCILRKQWKIILLNVLTVDRCAKSLN